jgi:hypothetical protein
VNGGELTRVDTGDVVGVAGTVTTPECRLTTAGVVIPAWLARTAMEGQRRRALLNAWFDHHLGRVTTVAD